MRAQGADRPVPLPCQALDHATGYLMAAAAIRGLTERLATGAGNTTRASLARSAQLLVTHRGMLEGGPALAPETQADWSAATEETSWGPARRVRPPMWIEGTPESWDYPASALGSSDATWRDTAR